MPLPVERQSLQPEPATDTAMRSSPLALQHISCGERAEELLEKTAPQILSILDQVALQAQQAASAVEQCVYFQFLHAEGLEHIFARGKNVGNREFWREIIQLLIFISKSAPRAVLQLIEGMLWAIDVRSELALALSYRAFMEQASSMAALEAVLANMHGRLNVEVWESNDLARLTPTDADREYHRNLLRYATGRRVERRAMEDIGSTEASKDWDRIRKLLTVTKESAHFAGQLLNDIDGVQRREGLGPWRLVYELLCEYCHPNSASRTSLMSESLSSTTGRRFRDDGKKDQSVGFDHVLLLFRSTVVPASQMVIALFDQLKQCRCPMPPVEGPSPRIRTIAAQDIFGRLMFVDIKNVETGYALARKELTEEQRCRIRKVFEIVGDLLDDPIEEWYQDFEHEPDDGELEVWECIADVFQRETYERTDCRTEERRLLLKAIVSSNDMSFENMLNTTPELKSLRRVDRVYQRTRERRTM